MAPKKQNAFMSFVHEWRKGRKMTVDEAVSHCGDIWRNMTAQERGPYKAAAKDSNVLSRAQGEPLNCKGLALSIVQREESEAAEEHMRMKRNIERIVLDGKARNDLENTKFIFVAFNYFTKAMGSELYIPAEFAAAAFSLQTGMTSVYSSHINPGQLIFGQGSSTQHHTSTTHQLPLPPKALGESDMGRLYMDIVKYLRGCHAGAKPNEPLVVFTATELIPVVKSCFRYLESDMEQSCQESIQVYDIQYLLYVLKKEVMDMADLPSHNVNKSNTDNLFLNDYFEYQSGISCEFHEENDRGKYCTQSKVTRWCYTFSDYMCGDLAIKPLPGKHMPNKQKPNFKVSQPETASGNTSFASFSSYQSEVKQEAQALPKFVPADHSAFSSSIHAVEDFPDLSGGKSKSKRQPLVNSNSSRDSKSVWHIPSTSVRVDDMDDAFNMPRR